MYKHFIKRLIDIVLSLVGMSDVFVFPSKREGLSVALMEAMASGLPIACSKIRGNVDLVDENGGELFWPNSISHCKNSIERLLQNIDDNKMGEYNCNKIKGFDINVINKKMIGIYINV